ncbi:3-keto-5-aminohexanoate cleavage protein [Cognatiyoonia sp. IB215446]|uniref:3-keto-5-aminohexanoate cleavage protein n=1 Tax=Cognatiyoonia sp. IB215446 TaxID=3097355 RepID=UPI002A0F8F24|nr:3-keto-5-aminohexanoate cleavage protein [Cognatiyoonia sp. IB215446]MDX8350640.1 3-keto-5-aminohexanoate cleavage protein [Cognatiyoonia sp. IB215446]
MRLPQIMVAPNGARLQKADHPALPITNGEIVACAKSCFAFGAGAIHAHIRDNEGQHILDSGAYRELVASLREALPDMAVQITTEAAGRYAPQHQMQVALDGGADMVSVSIREICRASAGEVTHFVQECVQRHIRLQYILYDRDDCALLEQTLPEKDVSDPDLQVLFVLGRYGRRPAQPTNLAPYLDWMETRALAPDWAVCAFGPHESDCLKEAAAKGGKCRTGFENSLHLSTGRIAPNNAAKVEDLRILLKN